MPGITAVHSAVKPRDLLCLAGVLASGGDDGAIAVWNLGALTVSGTVLNTVVNQERDKGLHAPHNLLFQHLGHRAQVRSRAMQNKMYTCAWLASGTAVHAQPVGGTVLNTVVNQERDKGLHAPHNLLFQHLGHRAQVRCWAHAERDVPVTWHSSECTDGGRHRAEHSREPGARQGAACAPQPAVPASWPLRTGVALLIHALE